MKEKILEKLKKLINHERSARSIGSVAEAEVFAEKIQQLLDEYNLSISEIDWEDIRQTIGESNCHLKLNHRWQQIFASAIANLNGCLVIGYSNGTKVVGNEMDRLVVIEIYEYFEALARAFSDRYLREYQLTAAYKRKRKKAFHSRQERASFLLGFVMALIRRFKEKHAENLKSASGSTALIFIGNKLADADAWKTKHLITRTVKTSPLRAKNIRDDAYAKGHAAGSSVALTTKTFN